MQLFKTEAFARFADREGRRGDALGEAAGRDRRGLIDAISEAESVKKSIARRGNVAQTPSLQSDPAAVVLT